MLPAGLPVPTLAVIHVIVAVPTNVPAALNTIPVHMPARPSADQLAITVKTALPEVLLTPVHTPVLPNAAAVTTAQIPVLTVLNRSLALGMKTKSAYLQPNAEAAAMNVNITQTAMQLTNIALTVVLIQTLAASAPAAIPNRRFPAKNITHGKAEQLAAAAVLPIPMMSLVSALTAHPEA